jgi:hypothetical protein
VGFTTASFVLKVSIIWLPTDEKILPELTTETDTEERMGAWALVTLYDAPGKAEPVLTLITPLPIVRYPDVPCETTGVPLKVSVITLLPEPLMDVTPRPLKFPVKLV